MASGFTRSKNAARLDAKPEVAVRDREAAYHTLLQAPSAFLPHIQFQTVVPLPTVVSCQGPRRILQTSFKDMATYAHRTDITVPIMTPTEATHPGAPSPTPGASTTTEPPPYSAEAENHATATLLSLSTSDAIPDAAASINATLPHSQQTLNHDVLKQQAQSLIETNKFTTKKQFKQHLEAEMEGLVREVQERARRVLLWYWFPY